MKIKTENGEANVASQGQSTLNTVLGAVGTAGSIGILGGILNPRNQQQQNEGDRPVTRYEIGLIRESISKDTEIAMLKGQQYTDRAMAGVQQQISMQQTWNAVQQKNIAMMQKQLGDITKFVAQIGSIDPVPTTQGTTQTTQAQQGGGQ